MKAHVLRGSKKEIAERLVQICGEVREAVVFEEETAQAATERATDGVDDIFGEMGAYMVSVADVDDSREGIYTRMQEE